MTSFMYTWLNFSASIAADQMLVPRSFRAVLNLRPLFNSGVLSSSHRVVDPLESYGFEVADKTITTWWVQARVGNMDVVHNVDVSAEVAAGCTFYDLEGFEIVTPGDSLPVGLEPVFAQCMR